MTRLLLTIFLYICCGITPSMGSGNPGGFRLAPVFGEHMVVQQKKPILFYGSSNRGDQIRVRFDQENRQAETTGELWKAEFPPVPAGGPHSLEIWVNDTLKIQWHDILSGEVWLCSGQSNMAFELKNAEGGQAAVQVSGDPGLRLFNYRGFIATDDIAFDRSSLDRINKLDYFKGAWQQSSPEQAADFSAIAYHFGRLIREKLQVPVGLVQVAVGGAPIESFIDRKSLEDHPVLVPEFRNREKNELIMEWVRGRIMRNIGPSALKNQRHPYDPAYIFDAGIAPLGGFPVQGVIWYQGESNAHDAELYRTAFKVFLQSWRNFRNDPELPFLFAQLSGIDRPSWPVFRDMQRRLAEEMPRTWMAVTSDLGDSLNVHPIRKREVGERLAALALNKIYGKNIVCEGPGPFKITRKEDRVTISFRSAGGLRTSDGKPLRELEIAGSDGIFMEVPCTIKGKRVEVPCAGQNIQAVRYAWKPFSHGNLVNRSAWPASTFLKEVSVKP
ncbi:MAG TPA: sialate O-acetylesterase [Prolixibacteraceae bacterium]|nr:sialate O-acetylesterase [Prolixibacteraceae bacterium]